MKRIINTISSAVLRVSAVLVGMIFSVTTYAADCYVLNESTELKCSTETPNAVFQASNSDRVYEISNHNGKVSFQAKRASGNGSTAVSLRLDYYANGNWNFGPEFTVTGTTYVQKETNIPTNATKIRFSNPRKQSYGIITTNYYILNVKDVKVAREEYLTISDYEFGELPICEEIEKTIEIAHSNKNGVVLKFQDVPDGFTFENHTINECSGTAEIKIKVHPTELKTYGGTVSAKFAEEVLATFTVSATGVWGVTPTIDAETTQNVTAGAQSCEFPFTINNAKSCVDLNVTANQSWVSNIQVNDGNFTYDIDNNTTGESRTVQFTLTYGTSGKTAFTHTVTVTQQAAEHIDVTSDGIISPDYANVTIAENVTATVNSDLSICNLVIKNGATLNVNSGKSLSVASLTIEGGLKTGGGYKIGQLDIAPTASLSNTADVIYYDFRINANNYYPLSVPCDVAVRDIDYKDEELASQSKYGTHYIIKRYDGLARATSGLNRDANWVVVPQTETLHPGVGYIMAAGVDEGHTSEVIRIPLHTSSSKPTITAIAHGAGYDADEANIGWNYIGHPYLADVKAGGVQYVSVPTYNFSQYDQLETNETVLTPEWGFFVQVSENTTITFAPKATTLPLYAPARTMNEDGESATRAAIRLVNEQGAHTRTNLIIDNAYTPAYEVNADLIKMFGDAYTMEVYTLSGSQRLAYNALDETTAADIALGYRAPVAGTYTLEWDESYASTHLGNMTRLELTDAETGIVTDLLAMPYSFETARTQSDNRFSLRAVYAPATPSDIDEIGRRNHVHKELRNGMLIIRREDKVYNVLGQQE